MMFIIKFLPSCAKSPWTRTFHCFARPVHHAIPCFGIRSRFLSSNSIIPSWPEFKHVPLNLQNHEIRLLELDFPKACSRSESELSEWRLVTVSRTENPLYTAISYVWGDPAPDQYAVVNKASFPITSNLHELLAYLNPLATSGKRFWIDALCIDQSNSEEKSAQVGDMRSIFQQAQSVWAWLGPNNDEAMRNLLGTFSDSGSALIEAKASMLEEWHEEQSEFIEKFEEMMTLQSSSDQSFLEAFWAVCLLPFWTRIWILQELVVTNELWFWTGAGFVKGSALYAVVAALLDESRDAINRPLQVAHGLRGSLHWIDEVLSYRKDYKGSRKFRFLWQLLLDNQGTFQASDPRDVVFALLGLCADGDSLSLKPDYTLSVREVFTAAARVCISSTSLFDILARAQANPDARQPGLPSWVPDWSSPPGLSIELFSESFALSQSFTASGSISTPPTAPEAEPGPFEIRIGGVSVDRIARVGKQLESFRHSVPDLDQEEVTESLERAIPEWIVDFMDNVCKSQNINVPQPGGDDTKSILFENAMPDDFHVQEMKRLCDVAVSKHNFRQITSNLLCFLLMICVSGSRKTFVTENGYIGATSHSVQPGDEVVIFEDSNVPFVLHPENECRYTLVGDAFVWGIMHGEFVDETPIVQEYVVE